MSAIETEQVQNPAGNTPPPPSAAASALDSFYEEHGGENDVVDADAGPAVEEPAGSTTTTPTTVTAPVEPPPAGELPPAPAPVPVAAPALDPAVEAYWSAPDPNPDLPPSLQGKSRRQVYDENIRAVQASNKAGMDKNTAERRAEVAEAALRVLSESALRPPAPAPAPVVPPPPPPTAFQTFGINDPSESYAAVPSIVEQLPGYIQHQAEAIADAKIAPIAQQLTNLIAERDNANARAQSREAIDTAERARLSAGQSLGIDPETWNALRAELATKMYARHERNQANPTTKDQYDPGIDARNPNVWIQHFNEYRTAAARLFPQTTNVPTPAPPAGNTRPGTAPAPATAARRVVTTGNKSQDAELHETLKLYGNDTPEMFAKVVERIKLDRRTTSEYD